MKPNVIPFPVKRRVPKHLSVAAPPSPVRRGQRPMWSRALWAIVDVPALIVGGLLISFIGQFAWLIDLLYHLGVYLAHRHTPGRHDGVILAMHFFVPLVLMFVCFIRWGGRRH